MAEFKINQPFIVSDFSGGLIDDLSVGKGLLPNNSVRKAINVLFDRPRGSISQRLGTTVLGTTAVSGTNDILGLFNHRSSDSSKHAVVAVANSKIWYLNGSNVWTDSGATAHASNKSRFLTYLDKVVRLDGSSTPTSSLDGI